MTDPHQGVPPGGIALDGQPHGGGFTSALGLVLTEAGPDRARAWAEVGPQHHQDEGIVHGGWYAAVVETVASFGAYTAAVEQGATVVGVSNTTEFFRPLREGRVEIAAEPVHQGRTQQVWEVRINRATDGKLVARGQLRLQHIVRREPHAAGNGSRPR